MSNRSMLEFNHDKMPMSEADEMQWLLEMMSFFRHADPENLPKGVTFFSTRHHSQPCPLGNPPFGWDNRKRL